MSYSAEISRANPTCFIFLIDRSMSMSEMIAGETGTSKQVVVADALNRLLTELTFRCAKEEGIRDFFHIAIIGYGGGKAESVLSGPLAGQDLVAISQIAEHPLRVEKRTRKEPDGAGGIVELQSDFAVWVEPSANGNTPMCKALGKARDLVRDWIGEHPRCYPPITLNLTDGEANDGDPIPSAEQLRALGSDDGQALLFNLHISRGARTPITFPDSETGLPDAYARTLFSMSSLLPDQMRAYGAKIGYQMADASRGFAYNADIVTIVQCLDIGSHVEVAVR